MSTILILTSLVAAITVPLAMGIKKVYEEEGFITGTIGIVLFFTILINLF